MENFQIASLSEKEQEKLVQLEKELGKVLIAWEKDDEHTEKNH